MKYISIAVYNYIEDVSGKRVVREWDIIIRSEWDKTSWRI